MRRAPFPSFERMPPNKPLQLTAAGFRCANALRDTNLGSITRGRS